VVILPDSIRSYLTKFADDDWLAANDLLPSPLSQSISLSSNSSEMAPPEPKDPFSGAYVRSLRLKPITTVASNASCESAIEIMRDRGFDQLPVLALGKRLVGLVTLGNILSRLSHGRASGKSLVSAVMFDFSKLAEVVTDPRDIHSMSWNGQSPETGSSNADRPRKHRKFVEITLDTPLGVLNRFFEWNSAAVVTEKDEQAVMKPVAVVTKVDLLTWMLRQQ